MFIWDYQLKEDWQPETPAEWRWFLVRKLNYDSFTGLNPNQIKKYFQDIQNQLDPGKRAMLANFLGID
jgi:hypothetical protein